MENEKALHIRIPPSKLLLCVALALLLAGSFFLPNIVAGVVDAGNLGKLTLTDTQIISFESGPALSVPDCIELIANRSIEKIPIKTGRALDSAGAADRVVSELSRCFGGGPLEFDFAKCSVDEGGAAFVIDTDDPSVNMIVWDFILNDPSGRTMMITLDDETGVIIKVIYRGDVVVDGTALSDGDGLYPVALKLTGMMEAYYGLPVILADYKLGGDIAYYKAELTSGDVVIPMYGIVRTATFTMNEQA